MLREGTIATALTEFHGDPTDKNIQLLPHAGESDSNPKRQF